MITLRRNTERGNSKYSWLDSRHTFSFGDYYDPKHMCFSDLRVINEDRVDPGAGFPTHSHRDMEIITYVLEGALAHKDSTGASSVIKPGDVQRMSAGTGISHSEYNASKTEPVHFLQIWIVSNNQGLKPGYEQRSFDLQQSRGKWVLVAALEPRDGAVKVHQDVELYLATISNGQELSRHLKRGRQAWLQITRGNVTLNGTVVAAGDGAAVSQEDELHVMAADDAEVLLFDLR
jgi:redox-sensitive bicupin YhaK (pirin superfamily)